jgi:hypothetical protein
MRSYVGRRFIAASCLTLISLLFAAAIPGILTEKRLGQNVLIALASPGEPELTFHYYAQGTRRIREEICPWASINFYGDMVRFSGAGTLPAPNFELKADLITPTTMPPTYPTKLVVNIKVKYKYSLSERDEERYKQRYERRYPEARYTYPYNYLTETSFEGEITSLTPGVYDVTIVYQKAIAGHSTVIVSEETIV